jgi:regulation of enolase protein 1 (concanavalin A-like superfamily)
MSSSLSSIWQFYDPFGQSSYTGNYTHVSVHSGPKTDWWHTAPNPYSDADAGGADRRSGPIAYQTFHEQEWTFSGWIRQTGGDQYQQTAIFVAPGPVSQLTSDKGPEKWLKTGIENDGGRFVGGVVTNPWSDWSVTKLVGDGANLDKDVFVSVQRSGIDVFVHYGLEEDKDKLIPLREVRSFGLGAEDKEWIVGVMVCGPKSESTNGEVYNITFKSGE